MTYAPRTLLALRSYLVGQTRLREVSLGIVGDTRHRSGYHLGRDRIYGPGGQRSADYSVRTDRDKVGLSDAASAIDIGNFAGLRDLSSWLAGQCRANAADTRDIREVIYSPDGVKVLRWDNWSKRLYAGGDGTGQGDDSHRWHTHVSYFRDSEDRDKVGAFRRFFAPDELPDTSTEDDMPLPHATVRERWKPTVTNGRSNGVLRAEPRRSAPIVERLPATAEIVTCAEYHMPGFANGGDDFDFRLVETREKTDRPLFVLRSDWISLGLVEDDCTADENAVYDEALAVAEAALRAIPRRAA